MFQKKKLNNFVKKRKNKYTRIYMKRLGREKAGENEREKRKLIEAAPLCGCLPSDYYKSVTRLSGR